MNNLVKKITIVMLIGVVFSLTGLAQAAEKIYVPMLTYTTGPYAPGGLPIDQGFRDYFKYVNATGGVNGVMLDWETCEYGYNTGRGVECYDRIKSKNGKMGVAVFPLSTGVTYALIPKTQADGMVLHSMGYGRTDASDGRIFSHVFTAPMTYWSQVTAITKYIGEQMGGLNNLKGKKIALVYHNSAYGKEPIKTLEVLSKKYGFKFLKYPVNHPGLEQKSTWLKIGRQTKPDFAIIFGWGVMTQTSIKEAKAIGYPVSKIIGNWWSASENDTRPAGAASVGYKAAGFHTIGKKYQLHKDILAKVYGAGNGSGEKSVVGEVLYNRALVQGVILTEAIRAAQKKYGNIAINGKQLAWGYEHVNLTRSRLNELGLGGFMKPLKITCANHEGANNLLIHEWDGNNWVNPSKWYSPMYDVTRPMIESSAAAYAKEKGITPRSNCN